MTRRSLLEKPPPGKPATVPRYVEIIRVSTKGQADRDTPQDQRDVLDAYARSHPGILVERIEYGARGLSGAKGFADRPDLQRLKTLSDAGAYDEVRVRWVNRLTRHEDAREWFLVFGMVMDAGGVIIEAETGTQLDPADEMGEFHLFLKGWFSRHEKREINAKTVRARRRLLEAGAIVIREPWGRTWDRASRSWRADDRIVGILRRAALAVLDGRSAGSVAADLNRDGIMTPRGRAWTAHAVCKILRQRHMVGRVSDGLGGERADLPAVIDEATWRRVCDRLTANRSLSGPPRTVPALLRGLARCGVCGAPMYPHTALSGGKRYTYYRCGSGLRARRPGLHAVSAADCRIGHPLDPLDRQIATWIDSVIGDPAKLRDAIKAGKVAPDDRLDPVKAQKDIDRIDAEIGRILRLAGKRDETATALATILAEAEAARRAAVAALNAAQAQATARERSAAEITRAEDVARAMRDRARAGGFAALREVVELIFPAGDPRCSLRIMPDGTLDAVALIPLDPTPAPPPEGPGSRGKCRKAACSIRSPGHDQGTGSKTKIQPDRPLADVIPLRVRIKP